MAAGQRVGWLPRALCVLALACGALATQFTKPKGGVPPIVSGRAQPARSRGECVPPRSPSGCWREWGRKRRTLLIVADPGEFAALPEAYYYLQNLKSAYKLPPGRSGCPEVHLGDIMGQPVAVVMTGIGPQAAAMCTFELLLRCGSLIKDAVSSGTSGWSPQLGGVLNNGTCEGGKANDNGRLARMGDVCVSPFAVNWDCHMASWNMTAKGYPNQCTFPELRFSPRSSELFGKCQFAGAAASASIPLTEELATAARAGLRGSMPPRPAKLQSDENLYWEYMAAGTQLTYPTLSASAAPNVWGHKECAEVDTQVFWYGSPWDMVARSYVADTLNAANLGRTFTQTDVVAVSAMEGVGIAAAFDRYVGMNDARTIPYTIVRGMSDWNNQPVKRASAGAGVASDAVGAPASEPGAATLDAPAGAASDAPLAADPSAAQARGDAAAAAASGIGGGAIWVEGSTVPEDFTTGYGYAIASSSAATLSMLRARCLKLSRPPPGGCAFEIKG